MKTQPQSLQSYFLLVNKPVGITSQNCLSRIKKSVPGIKKIGHHGTLDPFASGALLVGINDATKFFRFLDDSMKTYEAVLKLGFATDTLDCEGVVVDQKCVPSLDFESVDRVVLSLIGNHMQTPPMFSAVKVSGEKLYDKARRGETVERKSRPVTIYDAKLLSIHGDRIAFRVTVSRGTYVRVIGSELAEKLGTVGHLVELKRTAVCGLSLERSLSLEQLDQMDGFKISIKDLLRHLPALDLKDEDFVRIRHGKLLHREGQNDASGAAVIALAEYHNQVVGVLQADGEFWRSERLVDFNICNFSDKN